MYDTAVDVERKGISLRTRNPDDDVSEGGGGEAWEGRSD